MKYLPLLWAALWRRKPRTIFTGLSIVVSFLLFGLLQAFNTAINSGVEVSGADRLVTTGKYSLTQVLPYAYYEQIKNVDGVTAATHASWFGGVYQSERNFFAQFPSDTETYLDLYPEILIAPEQREALRNTRTGAIVAKTLADKFGWKIGDKIPLQPTIWPKSADNSAWELDLVGIFDGATAAERGQMEMMLFRHDYFDEARQFGKGTVGWFITRVSDPSQMAAVSSRIDALFANSPNPVKTQTEKAFNQGFIKQMGDIGFLISSIMGAVLFTLLMLTGNTMMQSVRERVPELAVLKTIGFKDGQVLALVLAESGLMCLLSAGLGIALAAVLIPVIAPNLPAGFSAMELQGDAVLRGIGIASVLALLVGALPARRAMRLDIVNALGGH
ncbi:MAG: ABC transporter permease [Panacagrimonas sp.]